MVFNCSRLPEVELGIMDSNGFKLIQQSESSSRRDRFVLLSAEPVRALHACW